MLLLASESFAQYGSSNLCGYQFVNQEILPSLPLLYTLQPTCNVECDVFFVMNFIEFVLSKFRIELLAANHFNRTREN